MAPNSAALLHPSVPSHFDFLLDPVPQPSWGLECLLVDRAELATKRLWTLAEIPSDGDQLPWQEGERNHGASHPGQRIVGSNTLHLEDGEWVYACTRGCNQSFRNYICFHGIPFIDRCTEACAKCRVPHRETKVNLSTELQPSIKGGSSFSAQRGIPRKTRCVRADSFTYQR